MAELDNFRTMQAYYKLSRFRIKSFFFLLALGPLCEAQEFSLRLLPGLSSKAYNNKPFSLFEDGITDQFVKQNNIVPLIGLSFSHSSVPLSLEFTHAQFFQTARFVVDGPTSVSNTFWAGYSYLNLNLNVHLGRFFFGPGFQIGRSNVLPLFYIPEFGPLKNRSNSLSFTLGYSFDRWELRWRWNTVLLDVGNKLSGSIYEPIAFWVDPTVMAFELIYPIHIIGQSNVVKKDPRFFLNLGFSGGSNFLSQISDLYSPYRVNLDMEFEFLLPYQLSFFYLRSTYVDFNGFSPISIIAHSQDNFFGFNYIWNFNGNRALKFGLSHDWSFQKTLDWISEAPVNGVNYLQSYDHRGIGSHIGFVIDNNWELRTRYTAFYTENSEYIKALSWNNLAFGIVYKVH
jgi:hypothetical protein